MRNDAAHSDLLLALFIKDELSDFDDQDALDRFQRKQLRENVEGMD